jgi:hypothetical protein
VALDWTGRYATDADLAIRCAADLPDLAPRLNLLATGDDGTFAPGARWTLASPTNDFAAQGLGPGCVCWLVKQGDGAAGTLAQDNDVLPVASAAGSSLVLTRPGGVGAPPGGAVAGATKVVFRCPSAWGLVGEVTGLLRERYSLADPPAVLYPTVLRQACVAWTLRDLYLAAARLADGNQRDDFIGKYRLFGEELAALLGRLDALYSPEETGRSPTVGALPQEDAWPRHGPRPCDRPFPAGPHYGGW